MLRGERIGVEGNSKPAYPIYVAALALLRGERIGVEGNFYWSI